MDRTALAAALRRLLSPGQVIDDPTELASYAHDASFAAQLAPHPPDVVVLPANAAEVARVVAFAAEHGIPVTPRGAATGQTGGAVPTHGGIVVALNHLNRVLELDPANLQVLVEPGVIHADLNAYLKPYGLLFPPDPGSSRMCTVGGMAANNAHGMRAMKYGSTAQWVLGLEVVLPDGRIITTGSVGSRALQSSAGYDLTRLFVGSEGTLGIITQLRLKLLPIPPARALVLALFDTLEQAGEAVRATFAAGILPAAIEILDRGAIRAVNLYRPALQLAEVEALLLFEVDGNPPGVRYDAERIEAAIRPLARHVEWAADPTRINALWEARSVVGAAASMVRPAAVRAYTGEDICVPLARVPEALRAIAALAARYEIPTVTYGHIGGGGIHAGLLIEPANPAEIARVQALADEIHRLALRLGGTTTGEHGVGLVRAPYMPAEHGPALETMWTIKRALDPRGIMNPGKLFPPEWYAGAGPAPAGASCAATVDRLAARS
jgi:glycolate oxidase